MGDARPDELQRAATVIAAALSEQTVDGVAAGEVFTAVYRPHGLALIVLDRLRKAGFEIRASDEREQMGDPKRHELKTITPYFQDVLEGRKTFELRKNDRGFHEGDLLWLREWVEPGGFTGRSVVRQVVYMIDAAEELLPPSITGLVDDHCVLGLAPVPWRSAGVYGHSLPTRLIEQAEVSDAG